MADVIAIEVLKCRTLSVLACEAIFPDSVMTVAAIDRLAHHSIILDIQAQSFRKRYAEPHNNQ